MIRNPENDLSVTDLIRSFQTIEYDISSKNEIKQEAEAWLKLLIWEGKMFTISCKLSVKMYVFSIFIIFMGQGQNQKGSYWAL